MTASEKKLRAALRTATEALEEMQQDTSQIKAVITVPSIYQTKAGLAKTFSLSRTSIYNWLPEFEDVVKSGRYGSYAILGDRINVAAFADFLKYRNRFKQKNARKYVPVFNLNEALDIIIPAQ